jgi:cyclohexa-1,5-dienecarbonyl-CoA hydratase
LSEPVKLERSADGRVATLTLDRPPLNILDLEMIEELDRYIGYLSEERNLHVLVVRGAGTRAFSAGVSVQDHTPDKVEPMLQGLHGAIRKLSDSEAATIAVVSGHCLGGGMEVALACDLVLAEKNATFGQPEIKLGCYPPVAAALYPRRIGTGRTLEMLLSGRNVSCEEAERLGLVHWRLAADKLDAKLDEILADFLKWSTPVARLTKRAVMDGRDMPFHEALDATEHLYLDELCETEDMAEGIQAFLDKRPPVWKQR